MLLPSEAQPEAYVCCREGRWMLENQQGLSVLEDGATVHTPQMTWEAVLSPDLLRTQNLLHRPVQVPLVVERRRGELRLGDCSFTIRRGGLQEDGLSRRRGGAWRDAGIRSPV